MGRDAAKAKGNPYYERRLEAARYNDSLYSREKASELLGISPSSLAEYETGVTKFVPVDKVVLMADLYNAPDLCNRYCVHECPIGARLPISDDVVGIERVTVKLIRSLRIRELEEMKDSLLRIAEDGRVTDEELDAFSDVIEYLKSTSKTISELITVFEREKNRKRVN